jgi:enoyl-CoA hydratase/carnithine racemase
MVGKLAMAFVPRGAESSPDEIGVDHLRHVARHLDEVNRVHPGAVAAVVDVLDQTLALDVEAALELESRAYSALLAGPEFARWLDNRGPRPLPPLVDDPVLLRRDRDVLYVTLNRPERRNAYGAQLRDALVAALDVALHDPDVRVVLDGAGPCFCAGGDLAEFGTAPDLETAHLIRTRHGAARPLHALAERTEVRLHGPCIGAGIELAAFAGRVLAAPGTTFRLPEIGMGLIPGAGGTVSIPRRIGVPRTLYLALSGVDLDVQTALAWGLVDEISPDLAHRARPCGPARPGRIPGR